VILYGRKDLTGETGYFLLNRAVIAKLYNFFEDQGFDLWLQQQQPTQRRRSFRSSTVFFPPPSKTPLVTFATILTRPSTIYLTISGFLQGISFQFDTARPVDTR
jgi:hypothetical protein